MPLLNQYPNKPTKGSSCKSKGLLHYHIVLTEGLARDQAELRKHYDKMAIPKALFQLLCSCREDFLE